MTAVVDTSFLIDLAHEVPAAVSLADQFASEGRALIAPTMVLAEYLGGSLDMPADADRIRRACNVEPFTQADALRAGQLGRDLIREGRFPGWMDALIGGFAMARELPVVTRNRGHFPRNEVLPY